MGKSESLDVGLILAAIRACTIGELVHLTGASKETVTKILDELLAAGLVNKNAAPGGKVRYTVTAGAQLNGLIRRNADLAAQLLKEAPE